MFSRSAFNGHWLGCRQRHEMNHMFARLGLQPDLSGWAFTASGWAGCSSASAFDQDPAGAWTRTLTLTPWGMEHSRSVRRHPLRVDVVRRPENVQDPAPARPRRRRPRRPTPTPAGLANDARADACADPGPWAATARDPLRRPPPPLPPAGSPWIRVCGVNRRAPRGWSKGAASPFHHPFPLAYWRPFAPAAWAAPCLGRPCVPHT